MLPILGESIARVLPSFMPETGPNVCGALACSRYIMRDLSALQADSGEFAYVIRCGGATRTVALALPRRKPERSAEEATESQRLYCPVKCRRYRA